MDHQNEVATLDFMGREDHHTNLYVWNVGMQVKDCYMHYGYVYAFHSIDVMVTCMIDVS